MHSFYNIFESDGSYPTVKEFCHNGWKSVLQIITKQKNQIHHQRSWVKKTN